MTVFNQDGLVLFYDFAGQSKWNCSAVPRRLGLPVPLRNIDEWVEIKSRTIAWISFIYAPEEPKFEPQTGALCSRLGKSSVKKSWEPVENADPDRSPITDFLGEGEGLMGIDEMKGVINISLLFNTLHAISRCQQAGHSTLDLDEY